MGLCLVTAGARDAMVRNVICSITEVKGKFLLNSHQSLSFLQKIKSETHRPPSFCCTLQTLRSLHVEGLWWPCLVRWWLAFLSDEVFLIKVCMLFFEM